MVPQRRRNFLPALIINILFWLSWFYVIFKIPPDLQKQLIFGQQELSIPLAYFFFFLSLLFSLSLTLAFVFSNSRRGFFLSLFICGILLLRLIKQAHFLNLLLLGGIFACLEVYFSKKSQD